LDIDIRYRLSILALYTRGDAARKGASGVVRSPSGVTFEEAWAERVPSRYGDQAVHVLSRRHLVQNKRATGRLQDLADIERLEGGE
jgi:hypothetical protein